MAKYLLGFHILWALILSSCRNPSDAYITLNGQAQGTTFHIIYSDSLQRDFSLPVDSLFRLIDHSMSLWDSTSMISRINRNDSTAIPDEHFVAVLNKASEISALTKGSFDVTVGPLVKAWGISVKNQSPLPDSTQVDSLQRLAGYQNIKIVDNHVEKKDLRIQLDFNAIAQGYTVDLISDFLAHHGVRHFLVEIGGEVRALGYNERQTIWQVGIDQPIDTITEGRPLQTTISLKDKALATSGSYRKFLMKDGKRFSHVIDPASGYPVSHNLLSVSVLADDCTTADGFATAFLVMGIDKAMSIANTKHMEIYCIYTDDFGKLQVIATPGFSK